VGGEVARARLRGSLYVRRPDDGGEDEERGVPEWWSRVVCLTTAVSLSKVVMARSIKWSKSTDIKKTKI
jgi:hypothetical protein